MPYLRKRLVPLCGFAAMCLAVCLAAGVPARAGAPQIQATPHTGGPPQPPPLASPEPEREAADPFRAGMEARRLKMQNDDRHKRLVSDTEKLLALSTELKDDVSKTTKNELSMDVIKKAAEIEKLAHDVKERMRS